ncbi:MAG TPA: hypothetical protein VFW33_12705 [Gemmataceae bacterium]|nr:hypothetical protein [Gemmataceae bacterium]
MRDSVHDNWVYAQAVDYERCRVVLHTVYPHVEPPEYTDIVFEGVTAVHFELPLFARGPYPANVLFDAEEAAARDVLEAYLPLLEQHRNYGWPVFEWSDLDDLAVQLTDGGARCFEVHGSCGLHGFVFAASMEFRPRQSRAQVAGVQTF